MNYQASAKRANCSLLIAIHARNDDELTNTHTQKLFQNCYNKATGDGGGAVSENGSIFFG
jgi:hypothetical protein